MVSAIVLLTMLGGTCDKLIWSKETKRRVQQIERSLRVLGCCDLVAVVEAENVEKLTSLVADKLRGVPGIESSETLTVVF